MRLEDLNWTDVEEYLKQDDRIMLILGACEQHGSLSLLTDVKIPLALADAVSRQTNVLVAPHSILVYLLISWPIPAQSASPFQPWLK